MKLGLNYLLYEERPDGGFKLLEKLSKDHPILCITTIYPKKLKKMYDLENAAIVWLTDSEGGDDTVRPERLDFELSRGVMNFLSENPESVVFIEGCEYLLLENDFKNVKKFFKRINDLASVNESTVLVSVSPVAFDKETVATFSKDFDISGSPDEFLEKKAPEKPAVEPTVSHVEPKVVKKEKPVQKEEEGNIDELLANANSCMKKRDYAAAIEAYEKVVVLDPNNTKALFNMAVCLQMSGRLTEAINAYDRLLSINPQDIDCLINKGLALRKMGNMHGAVESYRKAAEINPYDSTVWNNLGIALKGMGKLEEAIESYDKGLSARPNDAGLLSNKGVALKEAGLFEEALACYNKALAIDPSRENTRRNKLLLEEDMKSS
ncbi:MAG: tetratricopeptide repeat protein [Thermoplasmata archaeon]